MKIEIKSQKLAVDSGADLYGADLSGADLSEKENDIKDIKQIGNIGSRGGFTVFFRCKKSIEINCGCFWGDVKKFKAAIKEKHGNNKYAIEYNSAISFVKKLWGNE